MDRKITNKIIVSTVLISFLTIQCSSVFAYTKDETVYSKVNNNGESYQTIVSSYLKNIDSKDELIDNSILDNIKNVNGNETFNKDGEKIIWKSNGEDIYYQGDTNKELPINMKITYKLDGKEIKSSDIIGKNGRIEINLKFTNKEEHIVNVNGKETKMYTPFAVMSGLVLDNSKVKNIKVTKGKIIDNGQKSVVVGLCMPGMQESLGFAKEELEIPSNIKISFETENFELGSIITYASPEIIEESDINKLDKLDELFNQMNELKNSSEKLVDGTSKLNDGISTLDSSAKDLKVGTGVLADGADKAYRGANEIAINMNKITSGTDSLVIGEKEITSGLGQIKTQLPTSSEVEEKQHDLNELYSTNSKTIEDLKTANSKINAQIGEVETQISDLNAQIAELEKMIEVTGDENLKATLKAMESTKIALTTMEASMEEQENANSQLIVLLQTNNQALDVSNQELNNMEKLRSGIEQLYNGSKKLENGAKNLQSGSKELSAGTNVLANSMNELKNGADKLSSGTNLLKNGTSDLQSGSETLKDGMIKFNKEGIEKLYNVVNGDLSELKQRVEKLQDLAKDYISFSGNSKGVENEVKFIMITDELKKKDNENEAVTTEGLNLQNQITNKNEKNTEGK